MYKAINNEPMKKLKPIVENGVLQRILDEDNEEISSPYGVRLDEKTQETIKHNKIIEAMMSMYIMDDPGGIGKHLDYYTKILAKVFQVIMNDREVGELTVRFNNVNKTLKEVFTATTFNPLSSGSDQIGRMPRERMGTVHEWLSDELNSETGKKNHQRFLTKVKAISSFGTTVWQLLSINAQVNFFALRVLYSKAGVSVPTSRGHKFDIFKSKTRSSLFDDPITRARSERMPLVDGQPINGIYSNAAEHGLGFGQVVQHAESPQETERLRALLDQNGTKNSQINAIPRQNAPIGNLDRPFMLSDAEYENIPAEYKEFNLNKKIEDHYFNHGVGINRWQPYGIYGTQANLAGFPSAGAQSGGTTDVMLGLQMLGDKTIYGPDNRMVTEAITLAVAAFMNFGGYHTFSEVFPIGQSVINNEVMNPEKVANEFATKKLYQEMVDSFSNFNPELTTECNFNRFYQTYGSAIEKYKN
ncbi:hypothetical protein [Serratia inhibens]